MTREAPPVATSPSSVLAVSVPRHAAQHHRASQPRPRAGAARTKREG